MKKIGYILAAVYAVFSLSVTSYALSEIIQGAEDAVEGVADGVGEAAEGVADGAEDALGDGSDSADPENDPTEADTSDTEDDPAGADTSDTEAEVSSSEDVTTGPSDVGNTGATGGNPGTGVVLGCTALGMAAAGLTALAARKKK